MITFNFETDFDLLNKPILTQWIATCIDHHKCTLGEINYIFCDDNYLLKINQEFLNHDTLTDIISFDHTLGNLISGDIYISVERVKENAQVFNTGFSDELHRVMIHGVLHYIGFPDKTNEEKEHMRKAEDACLDLRLSELKG